VNHSISFERTVVRSCSKLNYEVAQKIIDGKIKNVEDMPSAFAALDGHSTDDLIQDVQKLHKLTQKLRKLRLMNGALILKKSAIQFDLDSQNNPIGYSIQETTESKQMVEELMLLTNALVARKLVLSYKDQAFLRNHLPPLKCKLEEFS